MKPTSDDSSKKIDVDIDQNSENLALQDKTVIISAILKDAWKLFIKTALPTLGLIVVLSLITAAFRLVYVPGDWYIHANQSAYEALMQKISDGEVELTPEENSLRFAYQIITSLTLLGRWSIPFFTLLAVILLTTGKIYFLQTGESDAPQTWNQSFLAPFRSRAHVFTVLIYLLIFPLFITIGLLLFLIPGIYIFIRGIFIIHAIVVDEHSGRMAFRGGKFYMKDNGWKLFLLAVLSLLIPLLIGTLVSNPVMNALGYSDEVYFTLIDPDTRNMAVVFLYYVVMHLLENIWFIPVSALFGSAFFHIRRQKIEIYGNATEFEIKKPSPRIQNEKSSEADKAQIRTVTVDPTKDYFYCPVCKQKLPLSARKCVKCGTLIQLRRK